MATNIFGGQSQGIGTQTFSDIGAGVSDIFAGFADEAKAQYDITEGQTYGLAAQLAGQNAQYTAMSTALKEAQTTREVNLSLGKTTAEVAGAGFGLSGSALDILRSSAQQGALTKAAVQQQGNITEAGYLEQQQSYNLMQQAANQAASAEKTAGVGSFIAGGLEAVAAIATL